MNGEGSIKWSKLWQKTRIRINSHPVKHKYLIWKRNVDYSNQWLRKRNWTPRKQLALWIDTSFAPYAYSSWRSRGSVKSATNFAAVCASQNGWKTKAPVSTVVNKSTSPRKSTDLPLKLCSILNSTVKIAPNPLFMRTGNSIGKAAAWPSVASS